LDVLKSKVCSAHTVSDGFKDTDGKAKAKDMTLRAKDLEMCRWGSLHTVISCSRRNFCSCLFHFCSFS